MSVWRKTILGMVPFIGSEALAAGVMSRGVLRWNYSAMHPDVYIANGARRDVYVNAVAAWLWTQREGIISGRAAAALCGVYWIPDTTPIELIATHRRRRPGVLIHDEQIGSDEITQFGALRITSPARTMLDLGRRLSRDEAVEHLDALASSTGLRADDVEPLLNRYRGARGITAARVAISLMDGGASSRRQTRLRLMLYDAGLPKPQTAIRLKDELWDAVVAIGWEGPKVCLALDDDLAKLNPVQRVSREDLLHRLGWFEIRIHHDDDKASIASRARRAIRQRARR